MKKIKLFFSEGQIRNASNELTRNQKKTLKACIIVLVRNFDFYDLNTTIRGLEKNFNHKYHYPSVLFNNEPFEDAYVKKN